MILGISCAHYGTVTQCSVDPRCASSAKTKHLETSQKLSETLKKNHETSRKQIFFEFRSISMNFQMYQNQKQSKCVLYNSVITAVSYSIFELRLRSLHRKLRFFMVNLQFERKQFHHIWIYVPFQVYFTVDQPRNRRNLVKLP